MPDVYVESGPKGRDEHEAINHYVLESAGNKIVDDVRHRTRETAINAAKRLRHNPLVARVRVTDKGTASYWRAA